MLRPFKAARKKLALRSGRLRGYGRLEGGLLAVCFLGACSLLAPLDDVQVDSTAGGSAAVSGAEGQGLAPAAGMNAAGGGGSGGTTAVAEGGEEPGEGGAAGDAASVKHPNGTACTGHAQCVSGSCVEGVCCDTSCDTACSSCRESSTGMADGVCGFVRSGADPDADCDKSSDCSQNAHCAKGKYCESNQCVTTKDIGDLCGEPAECTTGICGSYQTNVRPGHCCATPNCSCPGPAFANLLKNPGFDQDLAHWDIREPNGAGGAYAWYELEERDMCSYSGQLERRPNPNSSGYQVRLRQCVPVQQGTSYNFGGSWKSSRMPEYWPPYPDPNSQRVPDGEAWFANCVMAFYATMALCQDYDHESQNRFSGGKSVDFSSRTSAVYQWFDFVESMTAPQTAQAAAMDCSAGDDYAPNTYLYFDKFYISPAPSKY